MPTRSRVPPVAAKTAVVYPWAGTGGCAQTCRRALVAAGLSLVGALVAAPSASAAITCSYDAGTLGGTVFVQVGAHGDAATLQTAGDNIVVVDSNTTFIIDCPGAGGPPTVDNTEVVIVNDNSDDPATSPSGDGNTTMRINEPTDFSPGKTQEQGADAFSEIEMTLNFGGGSADRFVLFGTPGANNWRLGTSGINANAASGDPAPDADIVLSPPPDRVDFFGQAADDVISAQGGPGAGGPFAALGTRLAIVGLGGNDTLEGGNGNSGFGAGDSLAGQAGDDTVRGFAANDRIFTDPGDDTFDGGAGAEDLADYSGALGGVTVDLSQTGPQATGQGTDTLAGIEVVLGSPAADTLIGDAGSNLLAGANGADTLDGSAGSDELIGGDGVDSVTYAEAPAGVTANLTTGQVSGGGGGDLVTTAENLFGSQFADDLTGDATANAITGLGGPDTISALAGPDAVDVRDGGVDIASCGSEIDSATADQQGVDAINSDCENVSFLPTTPAEPQPQPKADRTLSLDANKSKVKKGKKVTLSGHLDAPGNEAACESRQTVEIQRKKPSQSTFAAFDSVLTDAEGNYSSKEKAKKTFEYRTQVPETATCNNQVSDTEKVKVKKK